MDIQVAHFRWSTLQLDAIYPILSKGYLHITVSPLNWSL